MGCGRIPTVAQERVFPPDSNRLDPPLPPLAPSPNQLFREMPTDGLSSLNGSIFSELGSDDMEYGERFQEDGSSKTGAVGGGVDLSPVDESPAAQTSRYGDAARGMDDLKWGTGGFVVCVCVGGWVRVRACVRVCVAAPWVGDMGTRGLRKYASLTKQ